MLQTIWIFPTFTTKQQSVSEYDQEISQSRTADQPAALWERATEHF